MRRWVYIATSFLIMLSLPVWAQHHGGGGHVSSGGGFAGHSSGSFHNSGSFHGGSMGHGSGIHVRTGGSNLRRRSLGRRSFYPYAYYPYLGYGWYSDPLDYQDDGQTQDSYDSYNQAPYREDDGLQRDVQSLNGKVDRLQQDVDAHSHARLDSEPETALVFRDQHVEEVRNYAISGGTVWVFNESTAKKIPLDKLDLDATVKKNDERGLDFQVPGPALSIQIMQ
jgi:hypothetical protein